MIGTFGKFNGQSRSWEDIQLSPVFHRVHLHHLIFVYGSSSWGIFAN